MTSKTMCALAAAALLTGTAYGDSVRAYGGRANVRPKARGDALDYRIELRDVRFPTRVTAGEKSVIESTWVNMSVAPKTKSAALTWSFLDKDGSVAWCVTDNSFDFRSLEPKLDGEERPQTILTPCRFPDAPAPLKPGIYALAVSVGSRIGTPEIALPLDGQIGATRRYRLGTVTVVDRQTVESPDTVETPVAGRAPSLLPARRKFKLAWSDEFDGDRLDESIWSYRTNFWGRPAHWFAHPSDNTVEVKDGLLHMKVAKRPDGQFVSPQLQTGEILWDYPDNGTTNKFWWIGKREPAKFQHRYGYWECRCKLQRKPGWWSAFWMQSENIGTTLDPADSGAEIDMLESFKPGIVWPHNVFACGYGADQRRIQVGGDWDEQLPNWEGWHYFGVLWNKDGYTFYVDGKEDGRVAELISHRPHFMYLTTECRNYRVRRMTGKADPNLDDAVAAGDEFIVDYVRVWDEVE